MLQLFELKLSDGGCISLLVLLDFSAAFHIINHGILVWGFKFIPFIKHMGLPKYCKEIFKELKHYKALLD